LGLVWSGLMLFPEVVAVLSLAVPTGFCSRLISGFVLLSAFGFFYPFLIFSVGVLISGPRASVCILPRVGKCLGIRVARLASPGFSIGTEDYSHSKASLS
jgi:hypothetical protein